MAGGKLLDIPVQDHVIVGHGRYLSFAEAGPTPDISAWDISRYGTVTEERKLVRRYLSHVTSITPRYL